MSASWGSEDKKADAPIYIVDAATGDSGTNQYGNTVFGVDTTEGQIMSTTAGWVRVTRGTGNRAHRRNIEPLVAMRSLKGEGSDDGEFPNVPVELPSTEESLVITGTPAVGVPLTLTLPTFEGTEPINTVIAWYVAGIKQYNSNSLTFTPTILDVDKQVSVEVTAVNGAGQITLRVDATGLVLETAPDPEPEPETDPEDPVEGGQP